MGGARMRLPVVAITWMALVLAVLSARAEDAVAGDSAVIAETSATVDGSPKVERAERADRTDRTDRTDKADTTGFEAMALPRAATPGAGPGFFTVHRALGTLALGGFAGALAISSASGNLGKLTDADRCCPDGGSRAQPWRNIDRALVDVGIVAYLGAGGMALYNMGFRQPDRPRTRHRAHRWLALAHGAAFATSMATGIIMGLSQEDHPGRFAAAARVHVTANVLLVPLLAMAYADILFE